MVLFPNPAGEYLEVRLQDKPGQLEQPYKILDQNGREVLSGKVSHSSFLLNVATLPTGIYTLSVPGFSASRFVKN
jgi:hypothetical protein